MAPFTEGSGRGRGWIARCCLDVGGGGSISSGTQGTRMVPRNGLWGFQLVRYVQNDACRRSAHLQHGFGGLTGRQPVVNLCLLATRNHLLPPQLRLVRGTVILDFGCMTGGQVTTGLSVIRNSNNSWARWQTRSCI